MDVITLARQEVRELSRPRHGGDVWQYSGINDYSSNLNPLGPPPDLPQIIMDATGLLHHYPDDSSSLLKDSLSDHHRIPWNCAIAGAGSSELIRLFPEVFLSTGDQVLVPRPTFSEYAFSCRLMGAKVVEYPLPEEDGFAFDFPSMLESLNGHTKAVYICNPNNPTSKATPRRRIIEFAQECQRKKILVFLDETLLDLTEGGQDMSCVQEAPSQENMFIIRSLTKSYAIPGMRIGYGVGGRGLIELMDRARLSWNLGSLEQLVAAHLITDHFNHVERASGIIADEKERMRHRLSSSVSISKPDSCFFFTNIGGLGVTGSRFCQEMIRHRVLVRDCASFGIPCDRYIRFCIKTRDHNDFFLDAFQQTVEALERA